MFPNPSPHAPGNDPTAGPLADRAFPELAEALRSSVGAILQAWEQLVREHVPPAKGVTFEAVLDGLPGILTGMATALASGDPSEVVRLMERSPSQGVSRFKIDYNVREVATEDRMLRRLIIEHVDCALGRRADRAEDVALNWVIDLMGQQAMVAFVDHQNDRLREAAESELKYLSFLSHDLRGNLGNVTLWLQVLKRDLADAPQYAEAVMSLDEAQKAILDTTGGMGRLLQAERLRHERDQPTSAVVDLNEVCDRAVRQFRRTAEQKGLRIELDVPAGTRVTSDAEMVGLMLQNLIGNAVKYSTRGTVRIGTDRTPDGRSLTVADDGPGIAPEKLGHIFDAFRRGEMHGQSGVGLGLAIVSRAAKLLDVGLTVESRLGVGSRFTLAFPART